MLNMRSCWCNCGLSCSKSQRRSCFRGRLEQLLLVLVLLVLVLLVLLQTATAAGIWPQPRKPPPCSRVVFETFAFSLNTERRNDFKQQKVYFSYRVFNIASFIFSRTGTFFLSMCFLQHNRTFVINILHFISFIGRWHCCCFHHIVLFVFFL